MPNVTNFDFCVGRVSIIQSTSLNANLGFSETDAIDLNLSIDDDIRVYPDIDVIHK